MARYGQLDMLVGDWGLVAPYWQSGFRFWAFPCYLGDEAQSLNKNWMFVTWQLDLGPAPTNSSASRFLVGIFPVSMYAIMPDDQTNLTLQAAAHAITESFNRLSDHGLNIADLPFWGGAPAPGSQMVSPLRLMS